MRTAVEPLLPSVCEVVYEGLTPETIKARRDIKFVTQSERGGLLAIAVNPNVIRFIDAYKTAQGAEARRMALDLLELLHNEDRLTPACSRAVARGAPPTRPHMR